MSTTIFALLISISQYAHPKWPPLKGTHKDTSAYLSYLQSVHSVPSENVLILKDSEATRHEIIERGFKKHLIGNKKMKDGDGVLIVFSGHGSRTAAPAGWPVVVDEDDEAEVEAEELARLSIAAAAVGKNVKTKEKTKAKPMVEMIVPYDEGMKDPRNGKHIPGIPDRTLGALLDQLAEKHPEVGDNITVVLDCCHSGHGTREGEDEDEEGEEGEEEAWVAELKRKKREEEAKRKLQEEEEAEARKALETTTTTNSEGDDEGIFYNRGYESALVTEIDSNTDEDILSPTSNSDTSSIISTTPSSSVRGRFTTRLRPSHILISACSKNQTALGDAANGGLLTQNLIAALKDPTVYPKTYTEVMKKVNETIGKTKSWKDAKGVVRTLNQNPRCEGLVKDKLVFMDKAANTSLFRLTDLSPAEEKDFSSRNREKKSPPMCRIEGGEVQGIQVGTLFEVYDMDDRLHRRSVLGTAVAAHVFPSYCFAELAENQRPKRAVNTSSSSSKSSPVKAPPPLFRMACILQYPYKIRFSVYNSSPKSPWTNHMQNALDKSLKTAGPELTTVLEQVKFSGNGPSPGLDLVLEIFDKEDKAGGRSAGISFIRQDGVLRNLDTRPPTLGTEEVEKADFPRILNAIARFNFYLYQTSRGHPYVRDVEFEMYLLERSSDDSDGEEDGGGARAGQKPQGLKEKMKFRDGEVAIFEDDEDEYAFVLRNYTSTPLYPYLIYFDTNTYAIETWYAPFDASTPTLIPAKVSGQTELRQLQIGASPEHADPFAFYLPFGEDRDTSFLKLLLLDLPAPAQQMGYMDQEPVIGCDENGNKHVLLQAERSRRAGDGDEEGKRTMPRMGAWDCMLRRITVRKRR